MHQERPNESPLPRPRTRISAVAMLAISAALLAGCAAPDDTEVETDAAEMDGEENVGEAQGAVTAQTLPDFIRNRQNKPPISYDRGAGTAVEGICPSGKELDAGLCYWACPSGYTPVGPLCWQGLDATERGVGTVPVGYGCPSGKEYDAGLCYWPCPTGYNPVGPVCWLDTDMGEALCEALYDPTIAAWAKYDHRTRTFGLGAGIAIGASASVEAGLYYGENGEYGCYTSTCYGVVTDASIEVSASFGDFQSLAALKGDGGYDLSAGVGYGVGGYTQSFAFDANNQLVGTVQQVSLGVGLSPIALGVSTCETEYMDLIAAPPQPQPGSTFYIVSGDGQLLRSHVTSNGTFDVVNQTIGTGWGGNTRVFAAGGGYVYLLTATGDLRYYHHNPAGTFDNSGSGTTIGWGWNVFRGVFSSGFGRVYAVENDGDLWLYEHDAAGFHTATKIGVGWNFPTIFSGGGNVVYAVDSDGRLFHYVHHVGGGWDAPVQIGTGWNEFCGLGSMGNGEIYGMTNNGTVLRYKHDPSFNWTVAAQQIGTGFSIYFHGMITAPH